MLLVLLLLLQPNEGNNIPGDTSRPARSERNTRLLVLGIEFMCDDRERSIHVYARG